MGTSSNDDDLNSLQRRLKARLAHLTRESRGSERWLVVFDDWHPMNLSWDKLINCLPNTGTDSGVVLINSEVNDGYESSPPTESFKLEGLAVKDGVRLLRRVLQHDGGPLADSQPWLPEDFEQKAECLVQRFFELPGILFLVGQRIRDQRLTLQVALENDSSVNKVISNMVSQLESRLSSRPSELALAILLLFVLAHLNSPCNIVDIFISAAQTLQRHPNQERVIQHNIMIPYLDDGVDSDKMGSKVQLALGELQRSHFLSLGEDNKFGEMEDNMQSSMRDLLTSRKETSQHWLKGARLLALACLGPKNSLSRRTMARHVNALLRSKPTSVQLFDVQLSLGPASDHAQSTTAAAECFADLFSDCGSLTRALDLRRAIHKESERSDSQSLRSRTCTALASAFAAVEDWPKAIELCDQAIKVCGDYHIQLSLQFDRATYLRGNGDIKQTRAVLGRLNQCLEQVWEVTENATLLRLWLKVARSNASILTENASDCQEGRQLLKGVLKIYKDHMKLPVDDRDLLSAKVDLANAHLRAGEPDNALKLNEELLIVFAESSAYGLEVLSTHQRKAECHSKLRQYDLALKSHENAYGVLCEIENDGALVPERMKEDISFNLAHAFHRNGDAQEARKRYDKIFRSRQSRGAPKIDIFDSYHVLLALEIDQMLEGSEPPSDTAWAELRRKLESLSKKADGACRANGISMYQRYDVQIRLEAIKIKYGEHELKSRKRSWWPKYYKRPLEMAVLATEKIGEVYEDVKQEFGETGALTLKCAQTSGRGHTLCACIKAKVPGPLQFSCHEDVRNARKRFNSIIACTGTSGNDHRERVEAGRYLAKLERGFDGFDVHDVEDHTGQDAMTSRRGRFLLCFWAVMAFTLYFYYL
jgi:tetratricopeptide (TPR) repeat protein